MTRSISILCHTLSGNAFGRALLLAQLLQDEFDVHLVTACRSGDEMWQPARGSCPFEVRRWTPFSYPGYVVGARDIARRLVTGDLIYCVKPRLPSYGLGLVARAHSGTPLILDIDDNELGFSSLASDLMSAPLALFSAAHPLHTRWLNARSKRADAVTVSNSYLHARHGGTWIPHARDADVLNAKVSTGERDLPTILFAGTPRHHKGVTDLLSAFEMLNLPTHLHIVGGLLDPALAKDAQRLRARGVFIEAPVAMTELPRVLQSADVIVIPQQDTKAGRGQLPAKLLDAMAMEKAIVSTTVGDIPRWLSGEAGIVVQPSDPAALATALSRLLQDSTLRRKLGQRARARFMQYGAIDVVKPRLRTLVDRVLRGQPSSYEPAPFAVP